MRSNSVSNDSYFEEETQDFRFNHPNLLIRFIERERIRLLCKFSQTKGIICDLGCEAGGVLEKVSARQKIGLDISPKALSFAPKTLILILGNATNTPFKNQKFDTVLMCELIEHVPNPEKLILEAHLRKKIENFDDAVGRPFVLNPEKKESN